MPKSNSTRPPEPTFRNKTFILIGIVLLVPIVPFALFGWWLEPHAELWTEQASSKPVTAAWVIGLLGSDILLPIPSSVISTLAGNRLGTLLGTGCSWLGMTLSALLGFGLARRFGERLLGTAPAALANDALTGLSLVLFRGLPILAEASVLHVGLRGMRWNKFWPPILLSNLGISVAYAGLGESATSPLTLAVLLGVVGCAPLLVSLLARRRLHRARRGNEVRSE